MNDYKLVIHQLVASSSDLFICFADYEERGEIIIRPVYALAYCGKVEYRAFGETEEVGRALYPIYLFDNRYFQICNPFDPDEGYVGIVDLNNYMIEKSEEAIKKFAKSYFKHIILDIWREWDKEDKKE